MLHRRLRCTRKPLYFSKEAKGEARRGALRLFSSLELLSEPISPTLFLAAGHAESLLVEALITVGAMADAAFLHRRLPIIIHSAGGTFETIVTHGFISRTWTAR